MSDNVKELFLKALEEKYAKKSAKTDDGDGMDAPGEEDADVDNDGDSDSSDKYLLKRRKAIAKAMKKEEAEDLEEGILGAIGGAALGSALGSKYAAKLGAAGAIGGAKLASKVGYPMMKGGKIGAAVAKAAPTAAGAVIGDRLTGRRKKKVNEEEMYEEEVYLVAAEFLLDEGIDYNDLTEDELNEFLGRMAKAMGRGIKRQTIDRVTTSGRADRAQRAADKMQKKNDTVARLQQQKKRLQQQKDRSKRLKQGRGTPMDRSQQGAQPA